MSVHHSRKSFFFDKRWHKDDLQSSKCKDGRTLASDLLWCFSLLVDLTEGLKCRRDLSRSYHPFTRAHLSLSPARKWSFSMAMALVICRMHWSSNDLNTNFVYVSEVSFPTNYLKSFVLLLVQQNVVDEVALMWYTWNARLYLRHFPLCLRRFISWQ